MTTQQLKPNCRPSRPELGRTPRSLRLRRRVNEAIRAGTLPGPSESIQNDWCALNWAAQCLGSSWLDHFGKAVDSLGIEVLASEPYFVGQRNTTELERFCEVLGLQYRLLPDGTWPHGRCYRIEVYP
jgi:hypothetical protein